MKLSDLIEQRAGIVAQMRAADATDKGDEFDAAKAELAALDAKIERQRLIDEADRRAGGPATQGDPKLTAELRSFSILRAIGGQIGLAGIDDGREREMQAELAKRAGRAPQGLYVPMEALEQRVLTSALPAGGPGGNLIATDLNGSLFIDRLRAALVTARLGATTLPGLVGNLDIPKLKGSVTSGWVAENTAITASDPQFDKVQLRPRHAGAITEFSRNMIQQSSPAVEELVRNDLALVLAEAVDRAAISGSGAGAEPLGILGVAGTTVVPMGTNGAAFTPSAAADMIGGVANSNGSVNFPMDNFGYAPSQGGAPANMGGTAGFLSNSKVTTAMLKLVGTDNLPMGIATILHGQRYLWSNIVPSNLTKGSGTNLSAMAFSGAWNDLLIGYWSQFDLLVNPYESAAYSKGNVSVRAMLTCDVAVRHPESFSIVKDIVA